MSAIAYITDSKLLELHRLNNHKTMNFWRSSSSISFSDFGEGDLVFFLSKDKIHQRKREKGIVGFGRVKEIAAASIKTMWDKYDIYNGYNTLEEFKEAIYKVCKDKKLPRKISGFYLEDVCFFQPVYLSECGMKISSNVESYIYLKPEEVVTRLLDLADNSFDLWSNISENSQIIHKEKLLYSLNAAHRKTGDIYEGEKGKRKIAKAMKTFIEENDGFALITGSQNELYRLGKESLDIVFYHDKETVCHDRDEKIEYLMNALL